MRETFERGDTVYAHATGGINNARFYRYQFFDKTGALKGPLSACFQGNVVPTPGYSYTTLSTDLLSDSASWSASIFEFNTSAACSSYNAATNLPAPNSSDTENFEVGKAFAFASAANRALCVSQTICPGATTTFAPGSTAFIRVLGYKQGNNNTNTQWFKPNNTVACANTSANDRPDADGNGTLDTAYPIAAPEIPDSACPALAAADAGQWRLELNDGGGGTEEALDLNAFTLAAAVTPTVSTEIHNGSDHSTGVTSVALGSTVHDKATVTLGLERHGDGERHVRLLEQRHLQRRRGTDVGNVRAFRRIRRRDDVHARPARSGVVFLQGSLCG